MDSTQKLLTHSQKLLSSLQERRSQSQVSSYDHTVTSRESTFNDQESRHSKPTPPNKGQYKKDSSEKTSHDVTEDSNKTHSRISPVLSSKPSGTSEINWNEDQTPELKMSKKTNFASHKNRKTENCTDFNAPTDITRQEPRSVRVATPTSTSPREDERWLKRSSAKHPKAVNWKEMSVPKIVVWPDTPVEDTVAIDIEDPLKEVSISPSTPLPPPPPPPPPTPPPPPPPLRSVAGSESLNSCEKDDENKPIPDGFSRREEKGGVEILKMLEENETGGNDIKTEREENALLSTNDEASKNISLKSDDDVEDGPCKEKKRLLSSRRTPLRRRSVSPVNTSRLEANLPVSILHRGSDTSEVPVATNNKANLNSEHPTMGQSLNNLANQTLQDNQKMLNERKCLGADLPLSATKKRRSFCDLLLEIPRKLSHVSETELGNVAPILKRSLANRKARKQSQETTKEKKEVESDKSLKDCFFIILSGMYGLMIVVLGAVIPISETFAEMETPNFFDAFYIYLFTCSGLFILYVYTFLLRRNKKSASFKFALNRTWSRTFTRSWSFTSRSDKENVQRNDSWYRRKITTDLGPHNPNGSFYLRLGAVGFGIGGMIHSGLQLGMHFQGIGGNSHCDSRMQAVKPLFHLIFTFSQLYFVFLNPKVCIHRYKTFARFGLMHMCGTNICVWFRNIVVETLHEMHHGSSLENHGNNHHSNDHHVPSGHDAKNASYNVSHTYGNMSEENITHKQIPGLSSPAVKCYWNEMMGKVVDRAAPYLYPCSIEYSLICAGIMYVLWQQVGRGPKPILKRVDRKNKDKDGLEQMRNNRMSVDCGSSSRGLFVGILLFVGAVITMVAFYVLVNKKNMTITALTLVHLSEISIYFLGMIATLSAAWRMRGLSYHPGHASVLENILVLISLTGVFIFCIFGIIAAIFHEKSGLTNVLSIASNLMMIIQSIIQTVFMIVASEFQAVTPEAVKKKPGREFVTFLILCNLSLWGINTFETQRSEHNPIQTDFYGHMAWAILTHISVPLGIFYRFHSTVCLSNIWKNAWKDKKH